MSHQPAKIGVAPRLVELAKRITAALAVKRCPPLEIKHAGIGWSVQAEPVARRTISLEARIDRSDKISAQKSSPMVRQVPTMAARHRSLTAPSGAWRRQCHPP